MGAKDSFPYIFFLYFIIIIIIYNYNILAKHKSTRSQKDVQPTLYFNNILSIS